MNMQERERGIPGDQDVRHGEAEALEEDIRVTRFSLTQLLMDLDEQWPSLKFMGFGCYYAWIYLCYNSSVLFSWLGSSVGNNAMLVMYLASTTALSIMLILAAIFHGKATRLIANRGFVLCMSILATVATLLLSWGTLGGSQSPLFLVGAVLTGIGTSAIALRLGAVYSTADARKAFMYTAGSFAFAGLLYFMCISLPFSLGLIMTAGLPLVAALFTMTAVEGDDGLPVEEKAKESKVSLKELPGGFFPRLVLVITLFSLVVGIVKGFATLTQSLGSANASGSIIVFLTGVIVVVLLIFAGLTLRDFDISQLYYPIIIFACLGILLVPLLGELGPAQSMFVSIAYTLFIAMIWCLLAHVANRTDLSSTQVFGWGRGASAAGTTIGWYVGSSIAGFLESDSTAMVALSIGMVFILLIASMLVFNEHTINLALVKTGSTATREPQPCAEPVPEPEPDEPAEQHNKGLWTKSCKDLAEANKLSKRERDVLFLLAKGRSIDYIANDLGISFNTAKSHIRHVYVKLGVHSKQELLNIIEEHRNAIR